jgi:hypothetical protein
MCVFLALLFLLLLLKGTWGRREVDSTRAISKRKHDK